MFNQATKRIYKTRLIQTRKSDTTVCQNKRLVQFKQFCNYDELKTNWTLNKVVYPYNVDTSSKLIQGIYNQYDNSGFYADLSTASPSDFYTQIDDLIANKWVDANTLSVSVVTNYYNINIDLFMIVRILYENSGTRMNPTVDFGLIDMTPVLDTALIASIILSFICIGLMMATLKKPAIRRPVDYLDRRRTKSACQKLCGFCGKTYQFISDNYRKPDFFETISKKF